MNKKLIVTILIVLIVVSLVQAVQLNTLKNTLEKEDFSFNENKPTVVLDDSLQTNIQNLPSMVGGC